MKHLLLVAITIAALTIIIVARRLKSDSATTISLNAAKHPGAFITVGVGVSVALLCAVVYYLTWLQPEYKLVTTSTILFFSIIGSFVLTSWIPDSTGWKRIVHRGAAYVAIFMMPLFLATLLFVSPPVYVLVVDLVAITALVAMLYLLFFVPKMRRWFLPFQALYLVVFFMVLILMTYFS